ncbi:hypothetical protein V6N11_049229 [Hibiscus sabdariffa]|uniref:BED-type domain-containing protein n=1 Tax=Hibiscus sabdariffa TaxID=183260 RepID=A0ABR2NK69_9ROSI
MESFVNDNVMNDDNIINSDGESYEEDSEVKSGKNIVNGDTMTKKKRKSSNSSISNAKGERKKMSYVWDHFKEISDSNNEAKSEKDVVECNYCGKCIAYKPSYGTSGMKNHIARCKRFPANLNRKQKLVDFESKTITSPGGTSKIVQKAFDNLYTKGGAYCKELRRHFGLPDDDDWRRVEAFLPFLQIFYETTLKVSGSLHVTSNSYVPLIFGVRDLISSYCGHESESMRKMAHQMKVKHDKYWGHVDNLNILLFVALLFDPRHKWDFVKWIVCDTYDFESANSLLSTIKVTLKALYEFYDDAMPQSKRKKEESSTSSSTPSSTRTTLHGMESNWLRQSRGPLILEEYLLELEELEDGMEDLTLNQRLKELNVNRFYY